MMLTVKEHTIVSNFFFITLLLLSTCSPEVCVIKLCLCYFDE